MSSDNLYIKCSLNTDNGTKDGNADNINYMNEEPKEKFSKYEFSRSIYNSLKNLPELPMQNYKYEPQACTEETLSRNETGEKKDEFDFFPKEINHYLLQREFFSKYDLSTLLYIFFYFPGSPLQVFAAKELEMRGWKYHTKFQTWFKRVSKPKEVNDKYEVADYDYFDYKTCRSWCIRRRNNFSIEHEYLYSDI